MFPPPPFTAYLIKRNTIQPGCKMQCFPIHTWQGPIGCKKRVLAKILRQLYIPCQPIEHTPDARLIQDDKSLKGFYRSLTGFDSQPGLVLNSIHEFPLSKKEWLNSDPLNRTMSKLTLLS